MVVYDIEIINGIENDRSRRVAWVSYCNGWGDFAGMGIACLCAYDFVEMRYRVFMRDNLDEFTRLVASRRRVVGFNNKKFDDKICAVNGVYFPADQSFDLLEAVTSNIDGDVNRHIHAGLSLNNLARTNLQRVKIMDGRDAPQQWQFGHHGEVIDYCLNDVTLTTLLLKKIMKEGFLLDPRPGHDGERIYINFGTEELCNG